MKRTTIAVNGKEIIVHSEAKTDKNHQTAIHITATHENVSLNHVMTIGAENEPLPENFNVEDLQKQVDSQREKLAALVESKHRATKLSAQIQ